MSVFEKGGQPFDQASLARHIEEALAVEAPRGLKVELFSRLVKSIFQPQFIDADKIPPRPCLFVANHSLFALDGVVLLPMLLSELGLFVRSLGDRFLWTAKTESLLLASGAVLGHPEVCSALMAAGKDILVFPGGAHEALKPKSQQYTLQWKERYGFVKMAAEYGYTIMPMALVGPEEFYDHIIEGEDILHSRFADLLRRLGIITEKTRTDVVPPLPRGSLCTLLPKPQRCYFQLGDPIDMAPYAGKKLTKRQLQSIRGKTARQIETMLVGLQALRDQERHSEGWLRRLLTV
ncbi:MAG: acyltransferase family protein [Gammaproteobacteria bacterium]|uniref:lysophospholipid acyltransferase family protein n=1 Tax=Pseudomaricurvus alcaniphilus TaxID=1166482 RepID=UPI00140D16F9|nr:lysophospholipid acyltransferase family protein [Pseudomaricurvus alcaniphilus]MBR9909721.1 acyltransferase family protein [Gammaproteobacteria bacterium]NHN38440.1 acyltransferase family protein [Pseudomaricurvus alcaniphilus]